MVQKRLVLRQRVAAVRPLAYGRLRHIPLMRQAHLLVRQSEEPVAGLSLLVVERHVHMIPVPVGKLHEVPGMVAAAEPSVDDPARDVRLVAEQLIRHRISRRHRPVLRQRAVRRIRIRIDRLRQRKIGVFRFLVIPCKTAQRVVKLDIQRVYRLVRGRGDHLRKARRRHRFRQQRSRARGVADRHFHHARVSALGAQRAGNAGNAVRHRRRILIDLVENRLEIVPFRVVRRDQERPRRFKHGEHRAQLLLERLRRCDLPDRRDLLRRAAVGNIEPDLIVCQNFRDPIRNELHRIRADRIVAVLGDGVAQLAFQVVAVIGKLHRQLRLPRAHGLRQMLHHLVDRPEPHACRVLRRLGHLRMARGHDIFPFQHAFAARHAHRRKNYRGKQRRHAFFHPFSPFYIVSKSGAPDFAAHRESACNRFHFTPFPCLRQQEVLPKVPGFRPCRACWKTFSNYDLTFSAIRGIIPCKELSRTGKKARHVRRMHP